MADDTGAVNPDQFGRILQVADRFTKRHLASGHGITGKAQTRNGVGPDALHRQIHDLAEKAGRPLHDH